MIVVSDTSPINYLVLIDNIDLLPKLFGQVIVPTAVVRELQNTGTPESVRSWMASSPDWLITQNPAIMDESIALGAGEREAISLAKEIDADLILIDDRKARSIAIENGLKVAGTLTVLEIAAKRKLIDLRKTFQKLEQTNFRISPTLLVGILQKLDR